MSPRTIALVFGPLIKSMRPHQWVKNVFVLAPLVFAQRLGSQDSFGRALIAFATFCLASSAVYLFNDLRDREEDRRHPLKSMRPLAAGTLGVGVAVAAAILITAVSIGAASLLGTEYVTVVVVYLLLNLIYTIWLKRVVIVDVMTVSIGYVLRVLGGGFAINVEVSTWLLLCTFLVALFLALSKRRHELVLSEREATDQRQVLSHYGTAFLDQMINVVTASTVVAYALYAISPDTVERFHTRNLIYTMPFVLFGVFRYLYLVYQRPEDRNPTEAILGDLPFLGNLVLWALAVLWIIYMQ